MGGLLNSAMFYNTLKRIISRVEYLFPFSYPVIAGGCLRDFENQREVKDIDVFLCNKYIDNLNSNWTSKIHCPVIYQNYGRKDMHGVWDFKQDITGTPVQLILSEYESPHELIESLDIGLCQIAYDGFRIYRSKQYLIDRKEKSLTICRADNDMEFMRSVKRIKRLREKYPEFKGCISNKIGEINAISGGLRDGWIAR